MAAFGSFTATARKIFPVTAFVVQCKRPVIRKSQRHADLVHEAEAGRIRLHVCVDGQAAIRLAMRHEVDAWFVASDLDDMSGIDLVSMLVSRPAYDGVRRHCVYLIARRYRLDEEQDALAAGASGYLVDLAHVRLGLESLWGRRAGGRVIPFPSLSGSL
jgi:CheY-like chemotaxis protein